MQHTYGHIIRNILHNTTYLLRIKTLNSDIQAYIKTRCIKALKYIKRCKNHNYL